MFKILIFINYNLYLCRIGCFIQFSSLQLFAWLLVSRIKAIEFLRKIFDSLHLEKKVLVCVDRLFLIVVRNWSVYFKTKQATLVSLICVLLVLILNSNVLIQFGKDVEENGSRVTYCYPAIDPFTASWGLVSSSERDGTSGKRFDLQVSNLLSRSTRFCTRIYRPLF